MHGGRPIGKCSNTFFLFCVPREGRGGSHPPQSDPASTLGLGEGVSFDDAFEFQMWSAPMVTRVALRALRHRLLRCISIKKTLPGPTAWINWCHVPCVHLDMLSTAQTSATEESQSRHIHSKAAPCILSLLAAGV